MPELEKLNSHKEKIGPNDKVVNWACPLEYDPTPLGPNEGYFIYRVGKGKNEMEDKNLQEIYRLRSIIRAQNEALNFWRRTYDGVVREKSISLEETREVQEGRKLTEELNREAERMDQNET